MNEMLVRVEGGRWGHKFIAAFVIRNDKVIEAAPYLRQHLMGRTTNEARDVIKAKGWKATVIRQTARD